MVEVLCCCIFEESSVEEVFLRGVLLGINSLCYFGFILHRWRRPTLTYVWNGTNGIDAVLPTAFSPHHHRSTDTQRHFPLWVHVYLATSASDLSASMKYQSLCQAALNRDKKEAPLMINCSKSLSGSHVTCSQHVLSRLGEASEQTQVLWTGVADAVRDNHKQEQHCLAKWEPTHFTYSLTSLA